MLSFEIHQAIIPPAPAPIPLPYAHISFLGHGLMIAEKAKTSVGPSFMSKGIVKTGFQSPMLQGTCCGYFDSHIGNPANVMIPIMLGFSSSKSLFVSGTVTINGANAACGVLVFMNLNLNCFFPVSMPVGVVYAFNTVKAGMSFGDIVAGVISGALQMAVEFVVGSALGAARNLPITRNPASLSLNNYLSRSIARVVNNPRLSEEVASAIAQVAPQYADDLIGGATGIALDQTPTEDAINTATTRWIGSDPRDVF